MKYRIQRVGFSLEYSRLVSIVGFRVLVARAIFYRKSRALLVLGFANFASYCLWLDQTTPKNVVSP